MSTLDEGQIRLLKNLIDVSDIAIATIDNLRTLYNKLSPVEELEIRTDIDDTINRLALLSRTVGSRVRNFYNSLLGELDCSESLLNQSDNL